MQSLSGSIPSSHMTTLAQLPLKGAQINATIFLDCHVDGLANEFYDCCSTKAQSMCQTIAFFDYSSAAILALALIFILFRSTWFRGQPMLIYAFSIVIMIFSTRGTFYVTTAYPDSSKEGYFLLRSLPIIELYYALTAYICYVFYLKKRIVNDFTGELDKSFRTDIQVFYMLTLIGLTLIYFFFLMMSLKFGTLQPLNVSLTVLYGFFFIGFIYVYFQLYEALKSLLPQVARQVKRHFIWMLVMSESIIFLRMIFISVTDIAQVKKSQDSGDKEEAWPGLLLGKALSEIIASYLLIGLVYLTWRVEATINSFYLHGGKIPIQAVIEHFKGVKQSDLKEGMDSVFNHLNELEGDLDQIEEQQSIFQDKLKQIDYSFLDDAIKPHITKFEDLLYSSISKIRVIQGKRVSLHNISQKMSTTLDNLDTSSVPLMDKLMKDLEKLRSEVHVNGDESLSAEKMEFEELERQWSVLEEAMKKEDVKLLPNCLQNFKMLRSQIEPVKNVLLQLDQIYSRISNNPYLNSNYMQKLRLQLNKDLDSVLFLEKDVIEKHKETIETLQAMQLRRINKRIVDGLNALQKIEKSQLSLLKDCNILFQFETKASEMKAQLNELKIQIDHETQKLKEEGSTNEEHLKMLIDVKYGVENHDIYTIDQEYFQVNMNKRNIDFDTCAQYIQQFELLMYRTVKSEEKIFDIVNIINEVQSAKQQSDEKVRIFNSLRQSIKEVDLYLTGKVQKDLNLIGRLFYDFNQLNLEELKGYHTQFCEQVANDVQRKLIKLQTTAMTANAMTTAQVQELNEAVLQLDSELKDAFAHLLGVLNDLQAKLVYDINSQRKTINLKSLQPTMTSIPQTTPEFQALKQQYQDLVQNSESFLYQDIKPKMETVIDNFRDLYTLQLRINDIQIIYEKLVKQLQDLHQRETLTTEHSSAYATQSTILDYLLKYITDLKSVASAIFPSTSDQEQIYQFQKAFQIKKQVSALQGYSEFNTTELKKCEKQIITITKDCYQVIEERITYYLKGIDIKAVESYKSVNSADYDLLKKYIFSNAKLQNTKQSLLREKEDLQTQLTQDYQHYQSCLSEFKIIKQNVQKNLKDHQDQITRLDLFIKQYESLDNGTQLVIFKTNNLKGVEDKLNAFTQGMKCMQEVESMNKRLLKSVTSQENAFVKEREYMLNTVDDKLNTLNTEFERLNSLVPSTGRQEQEIIDRKQIIIEDKNKYMKCRDIVVKSMIFKKTPDVEKLQTDMAYLLMSDALISYKNLEGLEEQVVKAIPKFEKAVSQLMFNAQSMFDNAMKQ